MTRTATLLAITVLSSIATPFVVNATGARQPSPAPIVAEAPAAAPAVVPAALAEEPSCTRRVRMVYRGYTDMDGGACIVAAK
jgi:hypothetical protein